MPIILTLLAVSPLQAADDPPLIGQPDHFGGAIGRFQISTSIAASEVTEGDPLPLLVRITSKGEARQGPTRPNLRQLKSFKNRFVIQDLPALDRVSRERDGQAWEYHYHLRPRSLEVHEVPPLLFVYYKPGVVPRSKGYWTTAAPSIPLTVVQRGKAPLVGPDGQPIRPPQRLYHVITGSGVLQRAALPAPPGIVPLALYALAPPALCLAWYGAWRRAHPDTVHLLRRRRSLAAQQALRALAKIRHEERVSRAREAADGLTIYLRDKLEIAARRLSPMQVTDALVNEGCPKPLVDRVAAFLHACDAAQYALEHTPKVDVVAEAGKVIHALEDWQGAASPRTTMLLGALLAVIVPASDLGNHDLLARAEQAFQAGIESAGMPQVQAHFRLAASLYEELRQGGADNPALALNLGNACMLTDDLPRAILAYRRGLILDPADAELRANLEYARAQVVRSATDAIGRPPVDHWPPGVPYPGLRSRLLLTSVIYFGACVALTRFVMTGQSRFLTLSIVAGVLAVVAALSVMQEIGRLTCEVEQPVVVIAADQVILRKGNGDSYPPRHELPLQRGVEARLLFQRGDWLQIQLPDGTIGWVLRREAIL